MAHVADELEHLEAEKELDADRSAGLSSLDDVPDVVHDRRALKVVPWAGDGPDPLGEETA